jgi:dienelactone hydrolase
MSIGNIKARFCALLLGVVTALAARGQSQPVPVPALEGQKRVGTIYVYVQNPTLIDPYVRDGAKRELMLRVWYPSAQRSKCHPAEYTPEKVWAYIEQLSGSPLPAIRTSSCLNAPIEPGRHPVVLFSHGYTGTFTDSTFLLEDLASHGYVVVSIAHTHESTAVEFPGGRLVSGLLGSYLNSESLHADERSIRFARSVRLSDLKFVLDELGRRNRRNGLLAGRLNLSEVGIMGHSLGGEVALSALQQDSRLKAAVALDPPISSEDVALTAKPVLMITAAGRSWSPEECQFWRSLHGPRLLINASKADHFTFSDASWMLGTSAAFPDDPHGRRTVHFLRNSIAGFFEQYLKESSAGLRPYMVPSQPGILVTTQSQSLCSAKLATAQGGVQ